MKPLGNYLAERWMARYKSDLDRQLEAYRDRLEQKRKRIEAEIGHSIYMRKTQFEAEFNALKDCFSALGKLRLSFNGLRPMMDWLPSEEEDRLKLINSRLATFATNYNAFVDISQSVFPFIPETIDVEFDLCAKAALLEVRHIEEDISKALSPAGYVEGNKQLDKFNAAYNKAAMLTRERFRQLSIVDENS